MIEEKDNFRVVGTAMYAALAAHLPAKKYLKKKDYWVTSGRQFIQSRAIKNVGSTLVYYAAFNNSCSI